MRMHGSHERVGVDALERAKTRIKKSVIGAAVALALVPTVWGSFYTVNPGTVAVITQMGAVQDGTYAEGFHFKAPFITTDNHLSIRPQTYSSKGVDAGTKDLQTVHTTLAVTIAADPTQIHSLYRNYRGLDGVASQVLAPAVEESMKAVTAKYTAEELITKREDVRAAVVSLLTSKLAPHFVSVKEVSMTNFSFSKSFTQAVEEKVTAEQQKLKADNDLQRIRVEAEQKVAVAEAEARSLKAQREQITKDMLELRRIEAERAAIEKWDGKLPQQMLGGAVPFVNVNK